MKIFEKISTKSALITLGTVLCMGSAAHAAEPVGERGDKASVAVYAGVGGQESDVIAGYGGFVWAPMGDLESTGLLVRGGTVFVDFDFPFAGGKADGDLARGNVSLGYQIGGDGFVAALFGGVDLQDYDFSPAAANTNQLNDDVGFIASARLATTGPVQFPASLEGNYSTANDTYWAQGRVGYRIDNFHFGPELAALGNDDFDALRFGGYASFDIGNGFIFQVNGGYNENTNSRGSGSGGNDGAYGSGTIVFVF